MKKEAVPSIFEKLGYDFCMRFYCSKDLRQITCIPYAFLKNFSIDHAKLLFECITKALKPKKFPYIIAALKDNSAFEVNAYQMRLLNALLSIFYGQYVFHKYKINFKESIFDIDTLAKSYNEYVAQELAAISYEDIIAFISLELDQNICCVQEFEEDKELSEVWKNLLKDEKDVGALMSRFFVKNGLIDDKYAISGKPRKQGISMDYIYNSFPRERRHEVSKAQLMAWDSGYASMSNQYSEDGTRIASFVTAGEQNFRYIFELFSKEIQKMVLYYNKPLIEGGSDDGWKNVSDYLTFLSASPDNTKNIELLKELVFDKREMKEWNLPSAFD